MAANGISANKAVASQPIELVSSTQKACIFPEDCNLTDEIERRVTNLEDRFTALKSMIDERRWQPDLLKKKLNTRGRDGQYMLHKAAADSQQLCVFVLLLATGADPRLKSPAGDTVWGVIREGDLALRGDRPVTQSDRHFVMRALLDFKQSCDREELLRSKSKVRVRLNNDVKTLDELRQQLSLWVLFNLGEREHGHRIYVPSTDGSIVLVIILLLNIQHIEDVQNGHSTAIASFHSSLTDRSIATDQNIYMDYRLPVYISGRDDGCAWPSNFTCVVLPCLALERMKKWLSRSKAFRKFRNLYRERNYGKPLLESKCRTFQDHTLDEAYYPGLDEEFPKSRNYDQVVSKEYRLANPKEFDHCGALQTNKSNVRDIILLVPQLWLWKLGTSLVAAYSMPRQSYGYVMHETHRVTFPSVSREPTLVDLDMLSLVNEHVRGFGSMFVSGDSQDKIRSPPVVQLFERHIASVLSDVESYSKPTARVDYREESECVHSVLDAQEELDMIQHILSQQDEILKAAAKVTEEALSQIAPKTGTAQQSTGVDSTSVKAVVEWVKCSTAGTSQNRASSASQPSSPASGTKQTTDDVASMAKKFKEVHTSAKMQLSTFQQQIKKIKGDADRIERAINNMIQLKHTHASIRDSHASLVISTAVIGFTIITIIFTPLSFVTSLFALKIDTFGKFYLQQPKEDKFNEILKNTEIKKYLGLAEGVTVAITILAIFLLWIFMKIADWKNTHDLTFRQSMKMILPNLVMLPWLLFTKEGRQEVQKYLASQKRRSASANDSRSDSEPEPESAPDTHSTAIQQSSGQPTKKRRRWPFKKSAQPDEERPLPSALNTTN